MFDHLSVQNLKAFHEPDGIELSKLTVLVGQNSSGKSTLSRFLPLLRQSVEARTRGPILWFGDYVDFGSFNTAKNKSTDDDFIRFCLRLKIYFPIPRQITFEEFKSFYIDQNNITPGTSVRFMLTLKESEGKTVASGFTIEIGDSHLHFERPNISSDKCELKLNHGEFVMHDLKINDVNSEGLVPKIYKDTSKIEQLNDQARLKWHQNRKKQRGYILSESEIKSSKAYKKFKTFFHGRTKDENIMQVLDGACIFDESRVYEYLKRRFREQDIFQKNLKAARTEVVNSCRDVMILVNLNNILRAVEQEISKSLAEIRYIGPMRAAAERYYRFQDLQVSELEPNGGNLVMLLASLDNTESEDLKEWSLENFGFQVSAKQNGSHYELHVTTKGSVNSTNVHDMGYGYSQILPIVVALWNTQRAPYRRGLRSITDFRKEAITYIIEQPELHLHPKLQHSLAVAIARLSSLSNAQFLIETHSKTFVEAIGYAMRNKIVKHSDVSLNIVELEPNQEGKKVSQAIFSHDGKLTNWPIGFFSAW